MKRLPSFALAAALVAIVVVACGPSDFDPPTKLESVRVLATRVASDEAYAKEGEHVTLETLAVDARPTRAEPMTIYWLPFLCQNPQGDSYATCFQTSQGLDGGAADAGGAPPGVSGLPKPGEGNVDVTPFLPTGPRFSFVVPSGIVARHKVVPGEPRPYGLVIVFNIACAGTHVEIKPLDPTTGQQQVPIGCFDDAGNELGPNDYVIGFSRVYVYADQAESDLAPRNANPAMSALVLNGAPTTLVVDPLRPEPNGIPQTLDLTLPACHGNCDAATIDVTVPEASWEWDTLDVGPDGAKRHESIWVDYFATDGNVDGAARLLYSQDQKFTGTEIKYTPPDDPGDVLFYAVVHDSRDGVNWLAVHFRIE